MKINTDYDNTFSIILNRKELLLLYNALDSMEHGQDYYFMAKEIADAIEQSVEKEI